MRFPCVYAAASTPVQRLGVILARLSRPYQPSPLRQSGRPAHRWLSASRALAYCVWINRPAIAPPNLFGTPVPLTTHPSFEAQQLRRALRSNLAQPDPAAKFPLSQRHRRCPCFPRFRALAVFRRRPPENVAALVIAGVRKPAQLQRSRSLLGGASASLQLADGPPAR